MKELLYRYEYNYHCEDPLECVEPILWEFEVIKYTPKGCFIQVGRKKRFILKHASKHWAHPSAELAMEGFRRRKKVEISILKQRIKVAEAYLKITEK